MQKRAKSGSGVLPASVLVCLALALCHTLTGAEPPARGQSVRLVPTKLSLPIYRALIVGINQYTYWEPLSEALTDGEKLAEILRDQYGFTDIRTLYDHEATLQNLDTALRNLVEELRPNDALLIYYAGHSFYDEQMDEAWWVPANAAKVENDKPAFNQWFGCERLKEFVRKMTKARHVLIVCDSCFSGALLDRGPDPKAAQLDDWRVRALAQPSRYALASTGAKQRAPDKSIFAFKFRQVLATSLQRLLTIDEVVSEIKADPFYKSSQQHPLLRPLNDPGGSREGQFVFVARSSAPPPRPLAGLPVQPPPSHLVATPPPLQPGVSVPPPKLTLAATPSAATKERPWGNSLGMKFVPMPLGRGGSNIVLFCIWETRRMDFEAFAKATGTRFIERERNPARPESVPWGPTHPIGWITREEAIAFCRWLTIQEHAKEELPANWEYRLPTDEEWSAAAGLTRDEGGDANSIVFPWGTTWPPPPKVGNYADATMWMHRTHFPRKTFSYIKSYDDGFAATAPVGTYHPNIYGLYDMGGNVLEWCSDSLIYGSSSGVLRGGSWQSHSAALVNLRRRFEVSSPNLGFADHGFRAVLAPQTTASLTGFHTP